MKFPVVQVLVVLCATQGSAALAADALREEKLEVSPGLRPEQVAAALEPVKSQLRDCVRLVAFGANHEVVELTDGLDDRVSVNFQVLGNGRVEDRLTQVSTVYLVDRCVEHLVNGRHFPPLPAKDVSVAWTFTWATTAAERATRRAEVARSLVRICDALSNGLPAKAGSGASTEAAGKRLAALTPQLDPLARPLAEALVQVPPEDLWTIFHDGAEEYGVEAKCPAIQRIARE